MKYRAQAAKLFIRMTLTDTPPLLSSAKPPRLLSLDAFRGLTIAAMLLVNNPGSWSAIFPPLAHAPWHGCTPTDLIFPFFLFIVGVAIPFSFDARRAKGASAATLARGVFFRSVSLILLGLLLVSVPRQLPAAPPDGFGALAVLHSLAYVVVPLGFVLLLYPWKKDLWADTAVIVTAVLWGLTFALLDYSTTPEGYARGSGLTNPDVLRFPGVLQRIGLCYLATGLLALLFANRGLIVSAVLLCSVYLIAMLTYGTGEGGAFQEKANLARSIDVAVFGPHAYRAYPDPEGLLSTLPAIATTLLGVVAGRWLKLKKDRHELVAGLLAAGVIASVVGVMLGWIIPINKQIWTPSYVVLTAGLACLGLGAMYYVIDVKQKRIWSIPFVAFGMNAIAMFLAAGIVGRLMGLVMVPGTWLPPTLAFTTPSTSPATLPAEVGLQRFLSQWAAYGVRTVVPDSWYSPELASLGYALAFVAVFTGLALLMYRAKIFLKV